MEYKERPATPLNLPSFNCPPNQTNNEIFDNKKASSFNSVSAKCKVHPSVPKQQPTMLSARALLVPAKEPQIKLIGKHSEQAKLVFTPALNRKQKPSSMTVDDTNIDYTSMLGTEEMKLRFSEDMVDMDLKGSIRLQKMYRQIQRQIRCNQDSKEQQLTE